MYSLTRVDGSRCPRDSPPRRMMPLCIHRELAADPDPRQGIHDRVPGAGNPDDRTFSALDLTLFYLFFEGGLIPMFLIIGVWGGPRRVYASFKFFLYTFLGSVLMLLAIMALYWDAGTTDIPTLMHHAFPRSLQTWAWLAFFASFAVKMPMWPVPLGCPIAHVEATTAGSVILAPPVEEGGYGFLRFLRCRCSRSRRRSSPPLILRCPWWRSSTPRLCAVCRRHEKS